MPDRMDALVVTEPEVFSVKRVPRPLPGPEEVLIRVEAVAVCGSDWPLICGKNRKDNLPPAYPFTPGHEGTGVIVQCGPQVVDFAVGDGVVMESHLGCGHCTNCRGGRYHLCLNYGNREKGHRQYGFTVNGCYSQFMVCHQRALHKVPAGVSFIQAAATDTFATVLHALERLPSLGGRRVLVSGSGPVGLAAVALASAMGAGVVLAGSGARLEKGRLLGAGQLVDYRSGDTAAKVRACAGGDIDVALECAGTAASVATVLEAVKRGGQIGLVATPPEGLVPVNLKRIMWDELTVSGSRGNPNSHRTVLGLMAEMRINPDVMLTHTFSLQEISRAFTALNSREDGIVKAVILPN